ncbi:MAG: hypothetical protein V7742_12345 [Halioglobus sp.]
MDWLKGAEMACRFHFVRLRPNYLRFGINFEDDFSGNSGYNIAARLTRTEINRLGGEFRAEIQLGETPRVFAEFFQPLDYKSRWFVNPQVEYVRSNGGVFDNGGFQVAEVGADNTRLSLQGGRQFGNWGEFRVGVTRIDSDVELRIGPPEITGGSSTTTAYTATFEVDTMLVAGSLFVVFDTVVGPIYIAYGAAEGGRQSAYLFLGQTF